MFKPKKRGQTALEYLVTYGWALLVIVIIAGILWYFGVFNPAKWTQEKQCGGFSSVQCIDFKIATDGTLTLKVGNKAGAALSALNITNGTGTTISCSGGTTLATNQQITCAVNMTGATLADGNTLASGSSVGTSYEISTVTLGFNSQGIAHSDIGFVKGKIES
ncbi:hypothetical protein AUJ65_03530 [Candidatus Micrarchaeota archaeon CG1_02_51_15]|nr:MAG: hypothetical protein AUJ65_03530 [Candidatus Micrarchaeota archaeon CG1_02_51_15]